MANSDGSIIIDSKIDTSGIDKGLDDIDKKLKSVKISKIGDLKKTFSDTAKETKVLGVSIGDLSKSFSKGGLSAGALAGVAAGLTSAFIDLAMQGIQMAITALKEFASEAIASASDVQEYQNVLDAVFESDKVEEWARTTADAFNMSQSEAMNFAGTMGAILTPSGLGIDTIEDMSIVLTQLSGDLGSLWNTTNEQAFNALRAAISGETEPIKQFGVNMSVANLETYALSQGVTTLWKDLSQGEQTLIMYNYLLENTATAQGDVARSAGSYAQAVKQLELATKNAGVSFGDELLPSLTRMKEGLATFIKDNQEFITLIGNIIGTLMDVFELLGNALRATFKLFQPIIDIASDLLNMILDGVGFLSNAISDALSDVVDESKNTSNKLSYDLQDLEQLTEDVTTNQYSSFKEMYEAIEELSGEHYDKLKDAANQYNNEFETQNNALDKYIKDQLNDRMKAYDESYGRQEKTASDYMKRAKYELDQQSKLERSVQDEREMLEKKYYSKLQTELQKQQAELAKQNTVKKNAYQEDVDNFSKAEKEKTKIYKEEMSKRQGDKTSSGGLFGSKGYAIGANNATRGWRWVGEQGPELMYFSGGEKVVPNQTSVAMARQGLTAYNRDVSTSTVTSSSVYNFNVQGISVEQVLQYARQKNRFRG